MRQISPIPRRDRVVRFDELLMADRRTSANVCGDIIGQPLDVGFTAESLHERFRNGV
jgi:hypothetical protein